ncbi:hypothetical protein GWI33_016540 [Rhynchophorus ferrugineus]|uniref:Uncharacterized protein n=1 Tax=Rhynchophorus ferrugineus TaxID=354439 RepID=A0A834I0Z6_RHYFE|nr:hypothetical protein GWI33_016540 [Rhynchophorus ferrugineus]
MGTEDECLAIVDVILKLNGAKASRMCFVLHRRWKENEKSQTTGCFSLDRKGPAEAGQGGRKRGRQERSGMRWENLMPKWDSAGISRETGAARGAGVVIVLIW